MFTELHGEDPTRTGLISIYSTTIIGTLILVFTVFLYDLQLSGWQWFAYCLVAADVLGGAVANMTQSTNRFYRSKPMSVNIIFLVLHLVHPSMLAFVGLIQWLDVILIYLYMLATGSIILQFANNPHQRVFASMLWVLGILLSQYVIQTSVILLWFVPIYLYKLLVAFAVTHHQETEN